MLPNYIFRWSQARSLPGANRLIKHLYKNGVPFALASNSLREHIDPKLSHQEGLIFGLLFCYKKKNKNKNKVSPPEY